jgi:hypothetical protein
MILCFSNMATVSLMIYFFFCMRIAVFIFAYLRIHRTLACRATTTLLMKLTLRMNNSLNLLNLRSLSTTNPNPNSSGRQSRGCVKRLQRSRPKGVTLTLGGRVSQVLNCLQLVLVTTCPSLPPES